MTTRPYITSQEIRRLILADLLHGGTDYYAIAEAIDVAPFCVRAELRSMRTDRLVRDHLEPERVRWELTNSGYELAHAAAQLTIRKEAAR